MDLHGLRNGIGAANPLGSIVPPIFLSTNYAFESPGVAGPFDYGRGSNPTRDLLAGALAQLEDGAGAIITASGMGALTLVAQASVPLGGRIVVSHDCYGGTRRQFEYFAAKGYFQLDLVDLSDLNQARGALAHRADIVLIETPSNPLLRITDIATVANLGHDAGALVVVDNTFCSPLLQHPLSLGADVVVHSTTKFINGHSDVLGGAVVTKDTQLHQRYHDWANALGLTGSPLDAWLTLRGLRTLQARMRIHQENAALIVERLTQCPVVEKVYYPGLETHPGHELASSQQDGFGSLISFDLAGGRQAVERFCDGLQVFSLAESLGGVESLVSHSASMTHASMSPQAQAEVGIGQALVRMSVGIEPSAHLLADLDAALQRAAG